MNFYDSNDSANKEEFNIEVLPEELKTPYDLLFKVIIIGNSGVGKSSLTKKAISNVFVENINTTVSFEFYPFNIKVNDHVIKLQIWDTCGQETFRSLIVNYYRNCSLAIIVYSIDSKESFSSLESWIKELKIHASPDVKIFLIATKKDLENERVVTENMGREFHKNYALDKFLEVSAKTGFNAKEVFIEGAIILYDDYIKYSNKIEPRTSSMDSGYQQHQFSIQGEDPKQGKKKECKC